MVSRIRSNPLIYPAQTTPGYDPNHVANRIEQQQTILSAVSFNNGSSFVNVCNGRNGTVSGTVTAGINSRIGPSPTFSGTSSVNFTIPSSTYISVTMAAIIYTASSSAGEQIVLASSSSNSGFRFGISGGNLHIVAGGVGDINPFPTIALSTATPYFIAVSLDTTTSNFVIKNLITGQVVAATNVSNTAIAGNGTLMIGNDFGNEGFKGSTAAVMINASTTSPGRLSLTDLVAWANDPWAYWYPRTQVALVSAPATAAPPFIPNSNDNFNVRQATQRAAAALLIVTQPFVPLNTTQVAPTVAKGWYNQLSSSAKAATAQPSQATSFAVPASATPTPAQFGWYQPLSKSAAVAQAKPGSTFVPFNTAQVVQTVVRGWYGQTSTIAIKTAIAQPTQPTSFAVPASVAPPAQTPGQFGWWANLSKPAPVAQAKPGNAFVPFNTAQVVISPQTVPLNYDAGSVQQRVVYYQSSFQVLRPIAVTPNTITGIAWFQPLGVPAPVAQAKPGNIFTPLNTTQITNTVTAFGWYQPLGRSAPVAQAKPGSTFVPLNTRQVNSITGIGWYQNLSRAAPVAIAQAGFSFVPFNTKQVVTVQVAFDPFVKKKHASKRRRLEDDLLRQELEIKYKRRLAIEEAFWPPTTYELPPYKLPEHVKPAPDVSDLANVIMQVQQMRAAQAKQQDEEDEKALLELLKREYGIEDV